MAATLIETTTANIGLVSATVANPFQQDDAWWEDEYAVTPTYKEKGKAVDLGSPEPETLTFDDLFNTLDDVEWKQFEPPAGLQWTEEAESEVVTKVVKDSVDRVKDRIIQEQEEEKQRGEEAAADLARKEAEEQKILEQEQERERARVSEEAKAAESQPLDHTHRGLSRAPPLPRSVSIRQPYVMSKRTLRKDIPAEIRALLSADPTGKPKSKRNRSIFSLVWKSNPSGKPETSAAGAARNDLHEAVNDAKIAMAVPAEPIQAECVSCLDDFDIQEMIKAPCHYYCEECFERLINTACENEQQWPPKCCLNQIPEDTITRIIRGSLLEKWRNRGWEWGLPVTERIYCSEPVCSIWCRPQSINRDQSVAVCDEGHRTCIYCRGADHGRETCPQDRELARTNELAEEEGWKRCYGCNAYVEHGEACQHMTCRCGAEFCYVCGARWRTCHCTMDQLAAVKSEADRRRQRRQELEAEQEAELQEILRQIEEFEREIALKGELLRQEQERVAEEQRQRELEERIRQEQARRQEVVVKFEGLREAFGRLHETQRSIIDDAHAREDQEAASEHTAKVESLKERHAGELAKLVAIAEEQIRTRQETSESEYAARLADEQQLEEQYASQLKLYWAGKPNGQKNLEASLKEFCLRMDRGFTTWRKWMDGELDTYKWLVREEQTIQAELMANAERRLHDANRAAATAQMQRRAGQLRWVDVVVEERAIMLREMEDAEIHGGEDIDAWFAEAVLTEESVAAATVTGTTTARTNDVGLAV
ncbi:ariadne-1 [Microdochium nivale]|nr:ariadne-1 [Microdochium nivale]